MPPSALRWDADNDFTKILASGNVPVIEQNHYDHILPALDFSIDLTPEIKGRVSYGRTIARPDFASLFSAVDIGSNNPNRPTYLGGRANEQGTAIVRRLRCNPAGGTVPRAAAACRRLAGLNRPFAPVPKDTACTQIYGGPQEARVTGTFGGRRVWVTFRRTDGCEIGRWNRVAFLFARG